MAAGAARLPYKPLDLKPLRAVLLTKISKLVEVSRRDHAVVARTHCDLGGVDKIY